MLYNENEQTESKSPRAKSIALLGCLAASIAFAGSLAISDRVTSNATVGKSPIEQSAVKEQVISYIIGSPDLASVKNQLALMGVTPTHELGIINSLAAELNLEQVAQLQQHLDVKISKNHKVETAGVAWGVRRHNPEASTPDLIEARDAHSAGNYGAGVTIGFLDTGLDNLAGLQNNLYGNDKYWGTYDAINNVAYNTDNEANGHGTHVGSIAGNSDYDANGKIYGVAPNALLVGIKAFNQQGNSTYADLIRGVEWAVTKKDDLNLRILNMSFSGPVHTYYWEDPLNIAIMKAWQAGIFIVSSAGNRGPNPMTIGVPANNPYILTVGAMTDNYTPNDRSDDKLASFSSTGPTVEGHIKPEVIAPGGHMSGLMDSDTYIVQTYPDFHDGGRYYQMSGTSQAAGVVSGMAALLLTADPTLTPDDVKCRIMDGASLVVKSDQTLGYSIFQQGAGMVNAKRSLASSKKGCANKNMDIGLDIAGQQHYYGPAAIDANGDFYLLSENNTYLWNIPSDLKSAEGDTWRQAIKNVDGLAWDPDGLAWDPDGLAWDPDGLLKWGTTFATSSSYPWRTNFESNAAIILDATFNVNGGLMWQQGISSTTTQSIGVNNWVEQE